MDFVTQHPERILLVGVILLVAFVLTRRGRVSSGGLADYGLLVAAAAWTLWAAWEYLVTSRSPEAAVRIDLLLIVPLVLLLTLLGIVREVWRTAPARG